MKNSQYFLLCYSVLAFSLFNAKAEELRDATTWEELTKTDSDTVNASAEKCRVIINVARKDYQLAIIRFLKAIPNVETIASLSSQIQDTVSEITQVMRACSRNIDENLENLGAKYLKRLDVVIKTGKSINDKVAAELTRVSKSEIDQSDELVEAIRQFVSKEYNPQDIIDVEMQQSLNYTSNNLEELQEMAVKEIRSLAFKIHGEIRQIEKTVISILNRISKGMTIIKLIYAALKKTGELPLEWSPKYIMQIVQEGTLMSKTTILEEDEEYEEDQIQGNVHQHVSTFKLDEQTSSEEDTDEEKEEDELGCILVFNRVKRKMLKQLIQTITEIKNIQSIKEIDAKSFEILQQFSSMFYNLNLQINSRIVDYIETFIRLYKMNMDIVDIINPGIKHKMEVIYYDITFDQNHVFYPEIQKYLTKNFLTSEKLQILYHQIESSVQGMKSLYEIQKHISKELISITATLGKELENMKMITIYILEEMKEGVLSLKHIKDNCNITGYRYYFNYFDAKEDLIQLKKLITILNMLDINTMFDNDLAEIMNNDKTNACRLITSTLIEEISEDIVKFNAEIQITTNITEMEKIITKYVNDYQRMIQNYTIKTRKMLKLIATAFVTGFEELIIMMRRKNIRNVDKLEEIATPINRDAEIDLIFAYLGEGAQIDIKKQYVAHFDIQSTNIDEFKVEAQQQLNLMTDTMISELKELDMQIKNILDKIITEAQVAEQIKREFIATDNYIIPVEQFVNLSTIMNLSKILQILAAQNNFFKSYNNEINKTINDAYEQIQAAAAITEQALQESINKSQIQLNIEKIKINIKSILWSMCNEIKENINEISAKYVELFELFNETAEDQELKEKIRAMEIDVETINPKVQEFLTNQYINNALHGFDESLTFLATNYDNEDNKVIIIEFMNQIIREIKNDMDIMKSEIIGNAVEKISRGLELMKHIQSRGKLVIDEEEMLILATTCNLVKLLQEILSLDNIYNDGEIQSLLIATSESITQEYTKTISNIQLLHNEIEIQDEVSILLQNFSNLYENLRINIQSKLKEYSLMFIETYESIMSSILGRNEELSSIMQNILNNEQKKMEDFVNEKAIDFIQSENFATSEWIRNYFTMNKQDIDEKFASMNETAIYQLKTLHAELENNIENMDELVHYVLQDFKESLKIIQSIQENDKQILNENQIESLGRSFQLIKKLNQPVIIPRNNENFNNAKQLITEKYQNTMKSIELSSEDTNVNVEITEAIKTYNEIYKNLWTSIENIFKQKSSDFSILLTSTQDNAQLTKNISIQNILAKIINNKDNFELSQDYEEIQSFIDKEPFQLSSEQNLIEKQQGITGTEKLSDSTLEVELHIDKMAKIDHLVENIYQQAIKILMEIENDEIVQVNQQQIITLTKAILISKKLSNNYDSKLSEVNVQSFETIIKESDIFSEAQKNILEEFDNAAQLIKEAADENFIKQIMIISIKKFDSILNDVQSQCKDDINNIVESYNNFLTNVTNIFIKNLKSQLLQKNFQNKSKIATIADTDFIKVLECINENYSTLNLATTKLEHNHNQSNLETNIKEENLNELELTTTDIKEILNNMEFIRSYIIQHFQEGIKILNEIEIENIKQLNKDQMKTLIINAQITQQIQLLKENSHTITFLSQVKCMIMDEIKATIGFIASMTEEANINTIVSIVIHNTDIVFNELKSSFITQIKDESAHFKEYYDSAIQMVQKTGNFQIEDILTNKNISEQNFEMNIILEKFKSIIENNLFNSTTAINDLLETYQLEIKPTNGIIDWNVNILQSIYDNIIENIDKIEIITNEVKSILQQGIEILNNVQNSYITELLKEQTDIIAYSHKVGEILLIKTEPVEKIKNDFQETESLIKEELETTIVDLKSLTNEIKINNLIMTTINNIDKIYTTLQKQVQSNINITAITFEDAINTFESSIQNNIKWNGTNQILPNDFQFDELLINIQSFTTSDIYNSVTPVEIMFDKIKQDELNSAKDNTEIMKILEEEIDENINKMKQVKQYILLSFEQGLNIIQSLRDEIPINLKKEQVLTISKCKALLKILSQSYENLIIGNSPTLENAATECKNVKDTINKIYENILTQIQQATNDESMKVLIEQHIQNDEDLYNKLKTIIQNQLYTKIREFKEIFESSLLIVKENGNNEMEIMLQNVPNSKPKTDESLQNFISYIQSDKYKSNNIIEKTYQEIQNNISQPSNNYKDQQIKQLEQLISSINNDINQLDTMSTFVKINMNQAINILHNIQNDSNMQLNEQEIQILSLCNTISTTMTTIIEETNIRSILNESINNDENGDLNTIKTRVTTERNNSDMQEININYTDYIDSAKEVTSDNEEKNLSTSISKSKLSKTDDTEHFKTEKNTENTLINNLDDTNGLDFIEPVPSLIMEGNTQNYSKEVHLHEEKKLDDITNSISTITHEDKDSNNLNSRSNNEQDVNLIETGISTIIDNVNENSTKGSIPNDTTNVDLNNVITNTTTTFDIEGLKSNDAKEIDFINTKSAITQEISNTINIITSSTNEMKISEALHNGVQNINNIYNDLSQYIQNIMDQTSQIYIQNYNTLLNTSNDQLINKLQDIIENKENPFISPKINVEYEEFEKFVTSKYFLSANVTEEILENIQNEISPEQLNDSIIEKSIQKLEVINETLGKYVDKMLEANIFAITHLQEATGILNQMKNKNIELTTEQINLVTMGYKIVNILPFIENSTQLISPININNQIPYQLNINVPEVLTRINEQLDISIKNLESITDKESIQKIMEGCISNYTDIYSNFKAEVQSKMTDLSIEFENDYNKTLDAVLQGGNDKLAQILQNISTDLYNNTQEEIFNEVESFIVHDKSMDQILDISSNLQDKNIIKSLSEIKEKGVEKLGEINAQLMQNINKMENTMSNIKKYLQNSHQIFQSIQTDVNKDLSDQQMQELAFSREIIKILKMNQNNVELLSKIPIPVIESIQENYKNAIDKITFATGEDEIQAVLLDNIQNYNLIYNKEKSSIQADILAETAQFNKTFQNLVNGSKDDMKNTTRNIMRKILENQVNSEVNDTLKQFQQLIQSSDIKNDIYIKMKQNENQFPTIENYNAQEELTLINTQIIDNITALEQMKTFILQNLQSGIEILKKVESNPNNILSEEEINNISYNCQINEILINQLTTNEEVMKYPTISKDIQSKCKEAINKIKASNDINIIQLIVNDTITNFENILNDENQNMEHKISEFMTQFAENYSSIMLKMQQNENNQNQNILKHQQDFNSDENFKKFDGFIKKEHNNSSLLIENILKQLNEEDNLISIDTIKQNFTDELETIGEQLIQSVVETEQVTKYVTKNLEKGSAILKMILENENIELTDEQIENITLSQHILQKLDESQNNEQIRETLQSVYQTDLAPVKILDQKAEEIKQDTFIEPIDFITAEVSINKKTEEVIQKINSTSDEQIIKQIIIENIQEYQAIYDLLQSDVCQKVNKDSTNFIKIFEEIMNSKLEDNKLKNTFDDIINYNITILPEAEEEYQKILSEINDKNIISSTAIENIYGMIHVSSSLPTDIKDRSIYETKYLNKKIKENIEIMKHVDQYISTIVSEGLQILKNIENEELVELNDEQIENLLICTIITKKLTQNENPLRNTFGPLVKAVVPSDTIQPKNETKIENDQNLATIVQNNDRKIDNNAEDAPNIYSTRSIISTNEVGVQEEISLPEEELYQCITTEKLTSTKTKAKTLAKISIKDLLINQPIVGAVDEQLPSSCYNLKWDLENYSQDDKLVIPKISESLVVARKAIETLIQFQQHRINLYSNIRDVLVVFVNTTEMIDEIFQQLSITISESMLQLIIPLIKEVGNNTQHEQLQKVSHNLDADFINGSKIFFSLINYERTDLLDLIDEQFIYSQCTSLAISQEIILEKLKILSDTVEKILDNINCTILRAINLSSRGKKSLKSSEKQSEIINDNQLLYEIINQVNGN